MKKALLIAVLVVFAGLALWFVWPLPGYDIERVHPRLRALQPPYQSITTSFFTDGGSVGIKIIDRDGVSEQFAIPAHMGENERYIRVYVGAIYDWDPGAVEVDHPLDTKRMLVGILAAYPNRTPWDDGVLLLLGHRPIDFVRCLIHRWKGDYDRLRKTH